MPAAGQVLGNPAADAKGTDLRIAFDFDGVLADDSSEQIMQNEGLDAFRAHDSANMDDPLLLGRLSEFLGTGGQGRPFIATGRQPEKAGKATKKKDIAFLARPDKQAGKGLAGIGFFAAGLALCNHLRLELVQPFVQRNTVPDGDHVGAVAQRLDTVENPGRRVGDAGQREGRGRVLERLEQDDPPAAPGDHAAQGTVARLRRVEHEGTARAIADLRKELPAIALIEQVEPDALGQIGVEAQPFGFDLEVEIDAFEDRVIREEADSGAALTEGTVATGGGCLLYTSPSPRDRTRSRMPSSA